MFPQYVLRRNLGRLWSWQMLGLGKWDAVTDLIWVWAKFCRHNGVVSSRLKEVGTVQILQGAHFAIWCALHSWRVALAHYMFHLYSWTERWLLYLWRDYRCAQDIVVALRETQAFAKAFNGAIHFNGSYTSKPWCSWRTAHKGCGFMPQFSKKFMSVEMAVQSLIIVWNACTRQLDLAASIIQKWCMSYNTTESDVWGYW